VLPSTFLVSNTNDSGPNSLRAAIVQLNKDTANPGVDVIDFHLPGAAPMVINLKTNLPLITHQVLIDGTSQPGYAGSPIVTLNGAAMPGADGLVIRATGTASPFSAQVKGLRINGFADGIKILDSNSSTPASIQLSNNSITSAATGDGILLFAGTGSTTAQLTNNVITTSATGDGIAAYTAGTADTLTFAGNIIHNSGGGDGIRVQGSGAANTLTFNNNHVFVQTGGDGIVVVTGPGTTTTRFVTNVVNTSGGGDGVALFTAGKSATFVFTSNLVQASGGGDGIRASGNALANDLTFTANHVFANSAGDALTLLLSPTSKAIARVTNNILNTAALGTGLTLQGGATFQAIVQGNGFGSNLVGVAVLGNGTTAGNVDLGGGSLGSTGGNDFRSFTHATGASYAIGLFNVAFTYSMTAKNNLFSLSPALVMADGSHDPAAGGSGTIIV
jgi:hypothetical protein